MRRLHIDFETFAGVSVKDVGVHQLVRDPLFTITAVAWAFDNDPVQSWYYPFTTVLPTDVWQHIVDGGTVCAHNAAFEYVVLRQHYGMFSLKLEQMECSMQRALAAGLPAGLAAAGKALNLGIVKDETKKRLMLDMSRPRGGKGLPPWHVADPAKLRELVTYCEQDVAAERALSKAIPDLSDFEKKVSLLDARSNEAGVRLDLKAVLDLTQAARAAMLDLMHEAAKLSGGAVTSPGTQTDKLLTWLGFTQGCVLPNVQKETIEAWLLDPAVPPAARRMLELRQLAAKASVAKLDTMVRVAGLDQRARGLLQYAGAGRTLRWAGRMVQPQNLPRGRAGVNVPAVIDAVARDGKLDPLVFGAPLEAISRALRGCFVAEAEKILVSLDLAQIEARVVAWLAGQVDVVDAFRAYDAGSGPDIYIYAAGKLGSNNRQLGKVVTLACGYGMGPVKFRDTAEKSYGVVLTEEEAKAAVSAWRAQNARIKWFWHALEDAVRHCIKMPGTRTHIGHIAVTVKHGKLRLIKPNGGILYYHAPVLKNSEIYFTGVNQTTKQWGEQYTYGGKLVENITQAVARDIMAEALLRIEQKFVPNMVPVMTVHDEAVYEVLVSSLPQLPPILREEFVRVPGWAAGLPIASDIKTGARYSK